MGLRMAKRLALSGVLLMTGCSSKVDDSPPDPPQSFVQLILEISGGYGPEPCSNGDDHYEVTQATKQLGWTGCDYGKTPSEPITGERTLSDAELDSVNDAFHGIALSTAKSCGADAPLITLDVTTHQGVERYVDDFYSDCPWGAHAGRTFVTGLGDLAGVLSELAKL